MVISMSSLIYLHGFASGPKPQSVKVALLRALGHDVLCLDTHGGYRPEDYLRAADALGIESSPASLLVGSSLGGFWARHLSARLGRPWIGLNPALRPSATLARFQGTLQRFDDEATFEWSPHDALAYRSYEDVPVDPRVPGLIVVAEDDDVVDPHETRALVGDDDILVLPRGGHELANTADYADALARFIESVTAAAG